MRASTRPLALSIIAIAPFILTGCSSAPEAPTVTPTTTTISPTPTETVSEEPEEVPLINGIPLTEDFTILRELEPPKASQPLPLITEEEGVAAPLASIDIPEPLTQDQLDKNFSNVLENVESFVRGQTSSPLFLSGEWEKSEPEEIIEQYGVKFSKSIQSYFDNEFGKDQNVTTDQSLGMFFSPTKNLTPPTTCTSMALPEDCLAGEYSITKANVQYDDITKQFIATVTVTGYQQLLFEGDLQYQPFKYTNKIWLSQTGKTITGLENKYTFSPLQREN